MEIFVKNSTDRIKFRFSPPENRNIPEPAGKKKLSCQVKRKAYMFRCMGIGARSYNLAPQFPVAPENFRARIGRVQSGSEASGIDFQALSFCN